MPLTKDLLVLWHFLAQEFSPTMRFQFSFCGWWLTYKLLSLKTRKPIVPKTNFLFMGQRKMGFLIGVFAGEENICGIEGAKVVTMANYTTEVLPPFWLVFWLFHRCIILCPRSKCNRTSFGYLQGLGNGHILTVCRGQFFIIHSEYIWI